MKFATLLSTCLALLLSVEPCSAGRQRISLVPESGTYSEGDIEKEIVYGREMSAIILAERKLSPDHGRNRYLNLVGQSIVRHANRPELQFFFAAVESDFINAYAAPGGYIFVTTAALDEMRDEAELAAVLAHEIAHVTERHIVKALNIREDDDSMVATLSKVISVGTESAGIVFSQVILHALDILFSKGLQVEDEYSADLQGIYLVALAGYDASAYYRYLARIQPLVEANQGELSGTHPPFAERLKRLGSIIEKEGFSTVGAYKNEKRFRAHVVREN